MNKIFAFGEQLLPEILTAKRGVKETALITVALRHQLAAVIRRTNQTKLEAYEITLNSDPSLSAARKAALLLQKGQEFENQVDAIIQEFSRGNFQGSASVVVEDNMPEILVDCIEGVEKYQARGWHRLSLKLTDSGHAIDIQLNARGKQASLMDPNMGLFCFARPGEDYVTVKARFIDFFNDLLALDYPDVTMITATEHARVKKPVAGGK